MTSKLEQINDALKSCSNVAPSVRCVHQFSIQDCLLLLLRIDSELLLGSGCNVSLSLCISDAQPLDE